ncbi:MAG: glycosyltransferase, partial [Acidobacteria bacterium]
MSRVAVVTSSPPFAEGGHLVIARSLVTALREAGHEAEIVVTPSHRFGRQASGYLATWLTDVGHAADGRRVDQVISLRYPSYAVRHPVHVCWLNHRMREYYDLWDEFYASLGPFQRPKERARRLAIRVADRYLLTRNVKRLFAQSNAIQARLVRFGGILSEVLYPPAPQRPYRCDSYGDYVFAVSRLTPIKRMDLLVEAMALPQCRAIRCVIGGDGSERERLERLIAERGLGGRVTLAGSLDSEGLVRHLAACRAVCFPTRAEDYGLVTVEAFRSAKAVITCEDSGGLLSQHVTLHHDASFSQFAGPVGWFGTLVKTGVTRILFSCAADEAR